MRLIVIVSLLVVGVIGVVALSVDGLPKKQDNSYKVRAIFDSAFSVIPGEDVRVAGVTVGAIDKLDVTRDNKAGGVLRIHKAGFTHLRRHPAGENRPPPVIRERLPRCPPPPPRAP